MKFLREIPIEKVSQEDYNNLEQWGFTLIFTNTSIEVWYQVKVL